MIKSGINYIYTHRNSPSKCYSSIDRRNINVCEQLILERLFKKNLFKVDSEQEAWMVLPNVRINNEKCFMCHEIVGINKS